MRNELSSRPIAYVTMHDARAREKIVAALVQAGWRVLVQPTGIHLLQEIADVVEGKHARLDPALIVIDAWARGCAGTTIAAGLRELGITIPIVLIAGPCQPLPLSADRELRIVDSAGAAETVRQLARAVRVADSEVEPRLRDLHGESSLQFERAG
jgi:hypothetical protein